MASPPPPPPPPSPSQPGGTAPSANRGSRVKGRSGAGALRDSSAAVTVVETERARREPASLGDVLARTEGVGVRRTGGLGSAMRLSLNGLTNDQIRFLLDGMPLALSGFVLGLASIPVDFLGRVEIYRGVVPIRFGADALGGAVNLVTDERTGGTGGSLSVQAGSFGTFRLALGFHHGDDTGLYVRGYGSLDRATNDYPVDVEVADAKGRLTSATVHRFHDGYSARAAGLEMGVTDKSWAERLSLRVFISQLDKELQHNVNMTIPYGEVTTAGLTYGGLLTWEGLFRDRSLRLLANLGYSRQITDFLDVSPWVYDWYGQRVSMRRRPGEVEADASDRTIWQKSVYGRVYGEWRANGWNRLQLSLAPNYTDRSGVERQLPESAAYDPLAGRRDLTTLVAGAAHQMNPWDDLVENVLFVKGYFFRAHTILLPRSITSAMVQELERDHLSAGAGDTLRIRLPQGFSIKASYEYATRLPRPDELFGDGVTTVANPRLEPEVSHNLNLALGFERRNTAAGDVRVEVNGFGRLARQLILFWEGSTQSGGASNIYANVYDASSRGIEASLFWRTLGGHALLECNGTWMDFRNASQDGAFVHQAGQRIPNVPWLFANASLRLLARNVTGPSDEVSLVWRTQYIHSFLLGWEDEGISESKLDVPAQLTHGVALTWLGAFDGRRLAVTLEADNITDEKTYDYFRVQRPGRAFYGKATFEYN